jgi:hypothetical protein
MAMIKIGHIRGKCAVDEHPWVPAQKVNIYGMKK